MSDAFWLSETQTERLRPFFAKARGRARVDGGRVLSGIIHVQRNGLMWKDAPASVAGPRPLTTAGSDGAAWACVPALLELAAMSPETETETVMTDATYVKAHRTVSSLRGRKGAPARGAAA